jgi:vacuolar iron transporter family protein
MDRAHLLSRLVDANDGILATAGVVEGLTGAGASGLTVAAGAIAATVAGAVALAGANYSEAAAHREAHRELVAEQRRQLALSPDEELAEVAAYYEERGLAPDLAAQVAAELTSRDPVAAAVEAEHGVSATVDPTPPMLIAITSAVAFAVGSGVPLAAIMLTPLRREGPVTLAVVIVALCVTGIVAARMGGGSALRSVARALVIGMSTMLVSYAVGTLFDL